MYHLVYTSIATIGLDEAELHRQLGHWRSTNVSLDITGFNTQIVGGALKSPNVKEYTVGFGSAIGTRGVAKIDLIYRDWNDFYATVTNLSTGKVGPNQFAACHLREGPVVEGV